MAGISIIPLCLSAVLPPNQPALMANAADDSHSGVILWDQPGPDHPAILPSFHLECTTTATRDV